MSFIGKQRHFQLLYAKQTKLNFSRRLKKSDQIKMQYQIKILQRNIVILLSQQKTRFNQIDQKRQVSISISDQFFCNKIYNTQYFQLNVLFNFTQIQVPSLLIVNKSLPLLAKQSYLFVSSFQTNHASCTCQE
ncbi:hypothetical protein TTHERM_000016059 (macronuclear) [Tetrahymena thermophila SB210]|uniref:Uncharacterized protein n=1 Tax=Tetrahymena thermophila (strain SB210) TaxID=312017 RepID=W7XH01_TETTS|nr:hypothetical protein TTHERM_000016059 [Tetrahymena thermophila SB210]EWS76368.1 hypothetical protein TTHERM_000016059 [Tetrahymena thermophila SB210]|eukprot:XP_012651152.1 hypothetical protein TTHERM_000016059 [Tetrahymena thermophila SB210]